MMDFGAALGARLALGPRGSRVAAARALYTQHAFLPCPPFGDYVDDGFSLCMTRQL